MALRREGFALCSNFRVSAKIGIILECWRFFLVSSFLIGARNSVCLEKFLFFNIQSQVLSYENPKQNNRVAMK